MCKNIVCDVGLTHILALFWSAVQKSISFSGVGVLKPLYGLPTVLIPVPDYQVCLRDHEHRWEVCNFHWSLLGQPRENNNFFHNCWSWKSLTDLNTYTEKNSTSVI